jgi:ribosome-binding protein aMBF1 (putative translation factor)
MASKMARDGKTLEFLRARYIGDDPIKNAVLQRERVNARVAEAIYNLRTKAGLSQRDLAARVGTSASVICQLEDTDYHGHSLSMLVRVAAALNRDVEIKFPALKKRRRRFQPT